MIFVTVGTQLAFDRLVSTVDDWAESNRSIRVFAQIGPGAKRPKVVEFTDFLPPTQASTLMREAELIVAHAGMGSILTALQVGKPILIMPRSAAFGEHRNDHQLATARWLDGRPGINVAWNESELRRKLDDRLGFVAGPRLPEFATGPLVEKLAAVLDGRK